MNKISKKYCNIPIVLRKMMDEPGSLLLLWNLNSELEQLINNELGQCNFPIDVESLAKNLNINVENEDLDLYIPKRTTVRIAQYIQLDGYFEEKDNGTIYVNNKHHHCTKRYGIALGIANYFLNSEMVDYEAISLCHTSITDIVVNNFALLLLLPICATSNTLSNYLHQRIKEDRIPITTKDWIQYLSEIALVSEFIATNGYQIIRNIFGAADLIADPKLFLLKNNYPDIFAN